MSKWRYEYRHDKKFHVVCGTSWTAGIVCGNDTVARVFVDSHNADIVALEAERDELKAYISSLHAEAHPYVLTTDYNTVKAERDELRRRLEEVVNEVTRDDATFCYNCQEDVEFDEEFYCPNCCCYAFYHDSDRRIRAIAEGRDNG